MELDKKDWSLKGKGQGLVDFHEGSFMAYETEHWFEKSMTVYYSKKDIEILRQELLKDVAEKLDHGGDWVDASFWVICDGVKEIINKRFGVEE